MNSLVADSKYSSHEFPFKIELTASSTSSFPRKYASLHNKLFPLACGPMRTVILPKSSVASLMTEKFLTVSLRIVVLLFFTEKQTQILRLG